jgi:hypothetical protein
MSEYCGESDDNKAMSDIPPDIPFVHSLGLKQIKNLQCTKHQLS